ncbi:MAG: restriction endonuclease subunit S, partial [Flavobacterium sp.]|uniref:restriction endonuclease subunit S n=1 Tax=Flavobacterium sp. TaxID=239 RepID=UPI003267E9F1
FPTDLKEQERIANYLTEKTAQIDNIISLKEKLIEKLREERLELLNHAVTRGTKEKSEMKPSGIDWINEIPNSWTTKRIKYIASIFGRIGFRGYQTSDLVNAGEGAITLSPSNMKEFEMDFSKCSYLSWAKYDESPEIQIENNDLLFVKTGSTFGKTSLVENLPEKATINPQLLVFKQIKINTTFFFYVLLSELIQAQVKTSVIGGTIPTISQEKIGNYYLFVPPLEEQKEIVAFVKKHLERIKTTISKIEQEIELIKEFKSSLINEVVTGKIILN